MQKDSQPTDTRAITMPKYKCHKEVWALKISEVIFDGHPGALLHFQDHEPLRVDYEYVGKHYPQAGGYYVLYEDGYASWSPADAFESGYSRL